MKVLIALLLVLVLATGAGILWLVRYMRRARAAVIEDRRRKAQRLWEGRQTAEVEYVLLQIERELEAERSADGAGNPTRIARLEEFRDLLQRIEAMQPQPVALDRALERAVARARERHPQLTVSLETVRGEEAEVLGDEELLAWAVEELIRNAREHGETTRAVRLEAKREGPRLVLRVADDGLGPDPTARARFYAAFTPRRGSPGPGLGLYAVRHLLDRLGGEIRAEILPEKGLAHIIMLPHRTAAPSKQEMPEFAWITQ